MNMRLLARRAEYARGAASGADVLRFFARRNSGISGALESRRHAQLFWALSCGGHLQGELQRVRSMEIQGSGRAAPLGNLLSIKHLNYFKTLRFVLCSKRDSRYGIAKRERNGVLKLQG